MTGWRIFQGGSWSQTGTDTRSLRGRSPMMTRPLREELTTTCCWSQQVGSDHKMLGGDVYFVNKTYNSRDISHFLKPVCVKSSSGSSGSRGSFLILSPNWLKRNVCSLEGL